MLDGARAVAVAARRRKRGLVRSAVARRDVGRGLDARPRIEREVAVAVVALAAAAAQPPRPAAPLSFDRVAEGHRRVVQQLELDDARLRAPRALRDGAVGQHPANSRSSSPIVLRVGQLEFKLAARGERDATRRRQEAAQREATGFKRSPCFEASHLSACAHLKETQGRANCTRRRRNAASTPRRRLEHTRPRTNARIAHGEAATTTTPCDRTARKCRCRWGLGTPRQRRARSRAPGQARIEEEESIARRSVFY